MMGLARVRPVVATAIAVASLGVYVLIPIVAPNLDIASELIFGAATASFVLVGLLLVVRAPDNRVGPVLLLAGTLLAFAYGCDAYGSAGAIADPDWPGSTVASVVGEAIFSYPVVVALIGIPLIFPDGRLISRRWRLVVWFVVVAMVAGTVGSLIGPTTATEGVANPLAVPGMESIAAFLVGFASVTSVIGFAAPVAAIWIRFRHGDPTERQQLKWLLTVAALAAVFFPIAFIVPIQEIGNAFFILGSLTLVALPLAIAVAILRYRLYDIDRIISRSISYALVSGALVVVFLSAVIALEQLFTGFTQGQTLAVAGSTLLAFALFQPLRRQIQHSVDRRFDRARVDSERTATAFAGRLRDQVDIDAVMADLDGTVRGALRPNLVSLWLRERD